MYKTANSLTSILSTIKTSFLPSTLFAFGLIFYFSQNPYAPAFSLTLHIIFLVISFLGLALLNTINSSKPFFTFLFGCICYLNINWLKNTLAENYLNSPQYMCLCFMLPLNLLIFYYIPTIKLRLPACRYILIALLLEFTLIQHYGNLINSIPHIDVFFGAIPLWSAFLWIFVFIPLVINISFKNNTINTSLFYASACLFMGLKYSDSASGLTTFFLCFALILFSATIIDLYNRYHYDSLENVGSLNSYLNQANAKFPNSKFPFKYTIGLFCVDNRDKLVRAIGVPKTEQLEQMIVNKIREFPYDVSIYRFNESELIMVFKNENARHVREYADNIRNTIAASEFVFPKSNPLKITISVCVSEKTRKDRNASEVIDRAHNELQRGFRFNCNVTLQAA